MASIAVWAVPKAVIRMTSCFGLAERMCCRASSPLIPVILMSRKMRSGSGPFLTIATPCSPLGASETT
jgi:hypothetical protein